MKFGVKVVVDAIAAEPLVRSLRASGMGSMRCVAVGHVGEFVCDITAFIRQGESAAEFIRMIIEYVSVRFYMTEQLRAIPNVKTSDIALRISLGKRAFETIHIIDDEIIRHGIMDTPDSSSGGIKQIFSGIRTFCGLSQPVVVVE